MTDTYFVDSNILVYRRDLAAGPKQKRAWKWLDLLWKQRTGRLSIQVLNEFYITVTQRFSPGLSQEEAREEVQDYFAWKPVPITTEIVKLGFDIQDRFRFSYWDSLIISAALSSGCRFLLSEDLQDGQDLDGLTVLNPLVHSPPA
ncbi:PIN domain-containing protein [Acidobacteriota bacterium]